MGIDRERAAEAVRYLHALCRQRGLTLTEAGQAAGIGNPASTLNRQRPGFPRVDGAVKLCEFLGVTVEEVWGQPAQAAAARAVRAMLLMMREAAHQLTPEPPTLANAPPAPLPQASVAPRSARKPARRRS